MYVESCILCYSYQRMKAKQISLNIKLIQVQKNPMLLKNSREMPPLKKQKQHKQ